MLSALESCILMKLTNPVNFSLCLVRSKTQTHTDSARTSVSILLCLTSCFELIQDHPIFQNNSNNPQLPVMFQLAIMLYHFGHYGNAALVESVAQWAGCSAGLVVLCMRWVIVAVFSLHNDGGKRETSNPHQVR